MNIDRPPAPGHFKSLQILDELSTSDSLTQRDISNRLGIALGLVNSYIKNLVAKGYITVKSIPPKRYAYYLTPKGFAEKTRLSYHLLQDYTRIYREAKNNLNQLYKEMRNIGMRKVVFAGSDEIAEIAYITLQDTDMELTGIVDDENRSKSFFGKTINPVNAIGSIDYDCVVITTYVKREQLYKELISNGVDKKAIRCIFFE